MGKQLVKELMNLINLVPEMKGTTVRCCPHCRSEHVVKNGRASGKQRFLCRDCGSTFNDYTNTILSYAHYPEKWPLFIECTLKDYPLRKSGKRMKVSYVSLFYWRHKLFTALKKIKDKKMSDVVEISDIYMGYSEKGSRHIEDRDSKKRGTGYSLLNLYDDKVCVIVAKDHNSNAAARAFFDGRIGKRDVENLLDEIIDENSILCTNNRHAYCDFARSRKVKQYKIHNGVKSLLGKYSIEEAKGYASDLEGWLLKFKGVASKYLNNYISCFKFMKSMGFHEVLEEVKMMLKAAVEQKVAETYKSAKSIECRWKAANCQNE